MKPIDGDDLKRYLAYHRRRAVRKGDLRLVLVYTAAISRIERMRPLRKGGYHE